MAVIWTCRSVTISQTKPSTQRCRGFRIPSDGLKIRQAAELFDQIFDGRAAVAGRSEDQLSYGEEGEIKQVFGDGFSVMYV